MELSFLNDSQEFIRKNIFTNAETIIAGHDQQYFRSCCGVSKVIFSASEILTLTITKNFKLYGFCCEDAGAMHCKTRAGCKKPRGWSKAKRKSKRQSWAPHSGGVNTQSCVGMKPSTKYNTFHLHHVFRAACFHVTVGSSDHILISIRGSPAMLYVWLAMHSQESDWKFAFFSQSQLLVCLRSRHKGWALEIASGKGRSKAEDESAAIWCVSSHGKSGTLSAGPNQQHLLEIDDDEKKNLAGFVTTVGFLQYLVREDEKKLLSHLFKHKIKYLSLCGSGGQKAELAFVFNNLSYKAGGSHATMLMQ